jgi:diketogulonate reductase-like aldo/keto reductase
MLFVEANGAKIPAIGLGTWELRGRACARLVEQALRLGYRHIDTAQMYENEREVGEGLRASGVKRDQVFLTTKIWPSHFAPHDLERSAKESLVRLRLTEVDLLLLHWPNPQVPLVETLGALARIRQQGLARHIGVRAVFVQNDWPTLIPSLERGTFDIALNGIEVTPALRARVGERQALLRRFADQDHHAGVRITDRGARHAHDDGGAAAADEAGGLLHIWRCVSRLLRCAGRQGYRSPLPGPSPHAPAWQ